MRAKCKALCLKSTSFSRRRRIYLNMKEDNRTRHALLLLFSFLSTSFIAGLVYGWPALRHHLLEEGSELSEKQLGAIFTIGAWSSQGGRFFAGLARDRYGTRATTFFCTLATAFGVIGLALSDANNMTALAMSLFSVGLGSGVLLCVQPVAGLFPRNSANVLFVLTGAFLISGLAFLALTSAFESRKASFLGYGACLLIMSTLGLAVLPKGKSFLQQQPKQAILERLSTTSLSIQEDEETSFHMEEQSKNQIEAIDPMIVAIVDSEVCTNPQREMCLEESVEDPCPTEAPPAFSSSTTAFQQMCTLEYVLLCVWFSICIVPLQYYVGSIGFQLERKGDDTGFYADIFSIVYASVAVLSPLAGYIADKFGLGVSQALATILTACALFLLALDNISLNVHIVGMICYAAARLYVYSMFFANIGKRFGYANFGTLGGAGLLVSAILSLLQFPLIAWADDGHHVAVNTACAGTLVALIPYCWWLHLRERNDSR